MYAGSPAHLPLSLATRCEAGPCPYMVGLLRLGRGGRCARSRLCCSTTGGRSYHEPVEAETVIEETIEGMFATKLVHKHHDVLSTWSYRAHYGYPTPALGRDAALNAIQPELQKRDIYSRGRFGGWKYEVSNQDHSLMQGVELVNSLKLGVPEVTYWFPGTANNMAYAKRP